MAGARCASGPSAARFSLSGEARTRLLAIAREAIVAELEGRAPRAAAGDLPPELLRPSGAFVTLKRKQDGELRGCVGYVEPLHPLHETIARAALAAALSDGRFEPVRRDELDGLRLDISVLGPTYPIDAARVEVGRHGLIVEQGARRGLLLPQVAPEWGWDAPTFVEQTCRKAGLPRDAWRLPDARLLAFEAEVFGED